MEHVPEEIWKALLLVCLSQLADAVTPAGKPATVCDPGCRAAGKAVLPYKCRTYINYINIYKNIEKEI